MAYTDDFLDRFKDDYEIVMTNGNGVLTLKSDEEKKPFFKTTDQLDFTLHATTRSGLETQYFCDLYTDPTVKDYNNIVVWLDVASDTTPTPTPDPEPEPDPDDPVQTPDSLKRPVIKVDIQLVEREYTITIPSDFVAGDDGGGSGSGGEGGGTTTTKPVITGNGFDLDSPVTLTDANAATLKVVIDMTLPTGVKTMTVNISSDNSLFTGAVADIGNPFDMLNLNSQQSALLAPVQSGQKTVKFDVSSFMSLLKNFKGTHKFRIYLEDLNGTSNTKILTIIAQ